MKNVSFYFLLIIVCCLPSLISAAPPLPELGYRWVLLKDYSDEFNGTSVDTKKWFDHYPGWNGRIPALFSPKALSVANGKLEIQNGVLKKPKGPYRYYGGAVRTKNANAYYGYYECKFIASKTRMSTTFWLSNNKSEYLPGKCENDRYSQELDIQECVGDGFTHKAFRTKMNSNTHFRYIACDSTKEKFYSKGASKTLSSEVTNDYHIYGAWWKDAYKVDFYADDEFFKTVEFSTEISDHPFDRPMAINLVTETYDWEGNVIVEDLKNPEKNTSYYDWVRSYKLIPINEAVDDFKYEVDLYVEELELKTVSKEISKKTPVQFEYTYKVNEDRDLTIKVVDSQNSEIYTTTLTALKGFGYAEYQSPLLKKLKKGETYTINVDIRPEGKGASEQLDSKSFAVSSN